MKKTRFLVAEAVPETLANLVPLTVSNLENMVYIRNMQHWSRIAGNKFWRVRGPCVVSSIITVETPNITVETPNIAVVHDPPINLTNQNDFDFEMKIHISRS